MKALSSRIDAQINALNALLDGGMQGLEGPLAMRFTEATRLIVFAVLLLMTAVLTTVIAVAANS